MNRRDLHALAKLPDAALKKELRRRRLKAETADVRKEIREEEGQKKSHQNQIKAALQLIEREAMRKKQEIEEPWFRDTLQKLIDIAERHLGMLNALEEARKVKGTKGKHSRKDILNNAMPPEWTGTTEVLTLQQYLSRHDGKVPDFEPRKEDVQESLNWLLATMAALESLPETLSPTERAAFRAGMHWARAGALTKFGGAIQHGRSMLPHKAAKGEREKSKKNRQPFRASVTQAHDEWRTFDPDAPREQFPIWLEDNGDRFDLTVVDGKNGEKAILFRPEHGKPQQRAWRTIRRWLAE